jgi:excisionase family DNA binding protein
MNLMPRYLTLAEVADRLRLSQNRVRQLVREGRLPVLQLTPKSRLLFEEKRIAKALRPPVRSPTRCLTAAKGTFQC